MARIDINRRMDGTVEFVPSSLQVDVGDSVFWRNLDPKEQHWITHKDQPKDFWFRFPLAPYTGEPPATTSAIVIPFLQAGANIPYICSLHETEEGMITPPANV